MSRKFGKIKIGNAGCVELVDYMGSDRRIVECAKNSFDSSKDVNDMSEDKIRRFIEVMIKNGHSSPFEQVVLTFKITAPIFVLRQLMRHRTARMNENSARYMDLSVHEPTFWEPSETTFSTRKEMSEAELAHVEKQIKEAHRMAYNAYNILRNILPKELARTVLPVSMYSTLYWQIDVNNLMKLLALRLDTHAQYEIREYAAAIFECAKLVVPITMDLFTEHRLYKIEISGDDLKDLSKFFDDHPELKVDGTPTGILSCKIDSANKVLDSINNVVENVRKYRTLIEDNTSSNA